jgi:four helix bundle protein
MNGYQDLKVWQLGVEISLSVYRLTEGFPQREVYGLSSQMRRASISIASNIAEGHSRAQTREIAPVLEFSDRPAGRLPETTDHEYGATPPVAWTDWL